MAGKSVVWIATLCAALTATMANADVQAAPLETSNHLSMDTTNPSGIYTDRLSPRRLKLWKSLTAMVLATDAAGNPLYARLHALWQAVATSGHVVYVELPAWNGIHHKAGEVVVEKVDQKGYSSAVAIRLYPDVIDHATSESSDEEFRPFLGLGKTERYLEVLGHELAHAVMALREPDYARKMLDLASESANYAAFYRMYVESPQYAEEMRQRAERIQILTEILERPACAAEMEVWRELTQKRSGK